MTGSSASGNASPIHVNTLTSQVTHHGSMTLVNSPKGVTMAWEAPASMNVAETARYMGVKNLQHQVNTDVATGETTSFAYTEFTHEEYEAYRRSQQGRVLELPAQPAEKQGNTIGTITFVPAPSSSRAEYANPPEVLPPEKDSKPNEHLQALIDKANDDRSLWQRTKDGAASAWDSTKRIADASWENPGEFGKGVLKGVGNLPSDLANLAVEGVKNNTGLNNYANLLDYQAMSAYEAGNIASANTMAGQANSIREFGQVNDIFEIKNDAQKGGSIASIFVPLGTVVKAGAGAAKISKAAKTVDAAADAAKASDVAGDVVKAGDTAGDANKAADVGNSSKNPPPNGPNGNGGKIKYRRPKKRVKCFCVQDHAKGGREEYDRQLKKQQNGINSMSASEYLAERKAYTGKDPCNGYKRIPGGRTKFRDSSVTEDARTRRLKEQSIKYAEEFRKKMDRNDAKRLGKAKAKHELDMQNALHNQDMYSGGKDVIGTLAADGSIVLTDDDFGIAGTNSHIGSQWRGERIRTIDMEACEMNKSGNGDEKLNIELRPCGKHESADCKQKRKRKAK